MLEDADELCMVDSYLPNACFSNQEAEFVELQPSTLWRNACLNAFASTKKGHVAVKEWRRLVPTDPDVHYLLILSTWLDAANAMETSCYDTAVQNAKLQDCFVFFLILL